MLSDPERRAIYDRYGHEGLRIGRLPAELRAASAASSDIFEAFFGGGDLGSIFGGRGRRRATAGPRRGGPSVDLTLEEVLTGHVA